MDIMLMHKRSKCDEWHGITKTEKDAEPTASKQAGRLQKLLWRQG
jgi:hypothetical protein